MAVLISQIEKEDLEQISAKINAIISQIEKEDLEQKDSSQNDRS